MLALLGLALGAPLPLRAADERNALVLRAESTLAGSDPTAAIDAFERIAAAGHGADGEMGLVRAYMQAGRYRQALAFGAHVAGEHFDEPGAGVLYAWLLRVGGHGDAAAVQVRELAARFAGDPLIAAAQRAFAAPVPIAEGRLLDAPHRLAPRASTTDGSEPPRSARVVAGAVLIDDGERAVMPWTAGLSPATTTLWVRDGLGATRRALIEPIEPIDTSPTAPTASGVTVLRLLAPSAADKGARLAPRDPSGGSLVYAAEYARSAIATPAWPQLRRGFVGAFSGDRPRRLAFDLEGGAGGPVFDAAGDVVGLAIADGVGRASLLPVSSWPATARSRGGGALRVAPEPASRSGELRVKAPDDIYELALRVTLQVIVDP